MNILFGHPTGNPNSHHAALAHFEAGRLQAFCVPWMPTPAELALLRRIPKFKNFASRLERRSFSPLLTAPSIQGRMGEWLRMLKRLSGGAWADERLSYEANDWLMRTMKRECHRSTVTAVHAYEDCSLWQFEEARRLGKACLYDLPIGYYPAWEATQAELARRYADWLPPGGLSSSRYVRPEQKRREMELADLVLVASSFVKETILRFHPDKKIAVAPYGVDRDFWHPSTGLSPASASRPLRFIYAGQISIRKGIPVLMEAWQKAELRDATLVLVGSWLLAEDRRAQLPPGVVHYPACSPAELRAHYQESDVFLFPSFFEGFGLVLLEALACGLPAVATEATAGPDLLEEAYGKTIPSGDVDALVAAMRWFAQNRDRLPAMKSAARAKAEICTWQNYRRCVSAAAGNLA